MYPLCDAYVYTMPEKIQPQIDKQPDPVQTKSESGPNTPVQYRDNRPEASQISKLQKLAGNFTSSKKMPSSGGVVQRKIRVAGDVYPSGDSPRTLGYSKREFRKLLMIALKRNEFKELGTKKMWTVVNEWLDDETEGEARNFDSWSELTEKLWDDGLLTRVLRGGNMGPKNLGSRPTFKSSTKEDLPTGFGQHRRHIISSSTLGRGIELGYEAAKTWAGENSKPEDFVLKYLNGWLGRNGGSVQKTEYKALREIWKIVHNHQGNLWVGIGTFNSAIGFIRTPLARVLKELEGHGYVKVEDLAAEIEKMKPNMKWLADAWIEIRTTLKQTVQMADPVLSATFSLSGAYLNWDKEITAINKEEYSDSFEIYRELDRKIEGISDTFVPLKTVIEELEGLKSMKKFITTRREYFPIYRKWIEAYAMPGEYIKKSKARELVEDWKQNCDLDYPYKLIEVHKATYFSTLTQIYSGILKPKADLFKSGGTLDKFMTLTFKA